MHRVRCSFTLILRVKAQREFRVFSEGWSFALKSEILTTIRMCSLKEGTLELSLQRADDGMAGIVAGAYTALHVRGAESHLDGLWLGLQSGKRKVSPSGEAGRGQTPREDTNQISDGSGYIFS